MEYNNLLIEEPIPQILSKSIFDPENVTSNNELNKINSTINELPEDEETILNIGDDTEMTTSNCISNQMEKNQLTNKATTLEDIFKATIQQMKINKKTQVDIDQCCYDFSKEISRLKISRDQTFQIRMIFDICKRQLKKKELERIIERCKIRVDESVRIKGFNRLIEDANKRLKAQEQLESMKGKLDAEIVIPSNKKYKDQQWNQIYNERFLKYKNEKDKKMKMKVEEKKLLEKKREEEIIELCKVKKAPLNVVEEYGKRLYEDQKANKDKDKDKDKDKSHHCGSKSHNKVMSQEEKEKNKELKDQPKGRYEKKSSQDISKKTCEDEDNGNEVKGKEEFEKEIQMQKEAIESIHQIEILRVNLKDHTKEQSKSQEKIKDKKIYAFSINKKEQASKLKKLKYNDFLPSYINERKVYDDKQTEKALNHFFVNQVAHD